MDRTPRPLTRADREQAFRQATRGFAERYAEEIARGMTDQELTHALELSFGIWGGSCGPGLMDVSHKASGLKIWGGWHFVNHTEEPPLFSGAATLAMARQIYEIADPDDLQLRLF